MYEPFPMPLSTTGRRFTISHNRFFFLRCDRNADYNTIFQMCYDQHMAHTRAGVRIGVDRASLPLADYMWVVRRGTGMAVSVTVCC